MAALDPTLPPAPHLTEPELADVDPDDLDAWIRAVGRGFQETTSDEQLAIDRAVIEPERAFGFRVGDRWVATFAALTRDLRLPGGAEVSHAAVTTVTVHTPYRRRGLLSRMMRHQLDDCVRRGEPVATLWASEAVIYGRFGFAPAIPRRGLQGRTRDLRFLPDVRTSGSVAELDRDQYEAVARRLHPVLAAGRPGTMSRAADNGWAIDTYDAEDARAGADHLRFVVHHDEAGEPDGFASYRFKDDHDAAGLPDGEVRVVGLWAEGSAYASLWRYLCDIDLARRFRWRNAAADEPLRLMVADHGAVRTEVLDGIYLRVVDVPAALRLRAYAAPVDVVVEVTDAVLPDNAGRWRLRTDGPTASTTVERTDDPADLGLDVLALGAAYLAGTSLADLHRAGRVAEHTPGAVAAASAAFSWHRAPWGPDSF